MYNVMGADPPLEPTLVPPGHLSGDRSRSGLAEAGLDQPRLDHHDIDAEALHLEAQGVRDRLHRMFRRVISAAPGEGKPAAHRAHVDDPPPALPAHPGEDELTNADQPEDVGLELRPDALHG